MHWYILTPVHKTDRSLDPFASGSRSLPCNHESIPYGHWIAAALREQLDEGAIVSLQGPFLCYEETLHFFSPLSHVQAQRFAPITWLEEQAAMGLSELTQQMLWDRRKPVPLMPEYQSTSWNEFGLNREPMAMQQLLPYQTVLKLLKNQPIDLQDWQPIQGEQHLAIAIDSATHEKLQNLGHSCMLQFDEGKYRFWLELYDEPLQSQWQNLQTQSQLNRELALAAMNQSSTQSRILAYLITPGLFERKQAGIATCRAFPWEWELAQPIDLNQHQGSLVSIATGNPISIRFHAQTQSPSAQTLLALQVFAVPPGSVYYLEYPSELFQDQPWLQDGRWNKTHTLRQLGYSEILWLPYFS